MRHIARTAETPITSGEVTLIYVILSLLIVTYTCLFCFVCFNFWRIMIKQKKYMLVPLTVFYISSFVIVISRVVDNVFFI